MRLRPRLRLPALALLAAGLSHASLLSLTQNGGAVPDNSVVGATFTTTIVSAETIALAGNGNVILSLTGIAHNWVGDLSFVLTHADTSTSVTIFDRPGVPDFSSLGYKANLTGAYAFGSGYAANFESAAAIANASNSNIPSASYFPEGNLNLFNGQSAGGTWTLFATDRASGDLVNTSWTWTLQVQTAPAVAPASSTPEPGSFALAAGALAALALRRRRR